MFAMARNGYTDGIETATEVNNSGVRGSGQSHFKT